jgi:site-specific DNA-methyltransferase (adenine-specific)
MEADFAFVNQIICDDSRNILSKIPSDSVDLVVTSPPYYNQRVYDRELEGIGGEKTLQEYLDNLELVFRECLRIIKPTGSVVFNIGDKYENDSLLLVPCRFAIRMTEKTDARLVNNITWVKPNPQPRQFKRRLVQSTEPFFHFVKSSDYKYFPEKFLARSSRTKQPNGNGCKNGAKIGQSYVEAIQSSSELSEREKKLALEELAQVVNEVKEGKISSFRMKIRGIHSASYGGYEGGRKMHIEKKGFTIIRMKGEPLKKDVIECPILHLKFVGHPAVYPEYIIHELLNLLTERNDIVVDPFLGSGTTCTVAKRMQRRYVGIDINPKFCKIARERVENTAMQA